MSAGQHTSGPWAVGTHTRDPFYVTSSAGIVASSLVGYAANPARAQANARLIAAAPCMYLIVANRAACGDKDAIALMEKVNGDA